MLEQAEWGEYKLGNLFEIQSTLSFNKDKLVDGVDGADYDYVTRTSLNQGILQTTGFVNEENLNDSGCWSLGLLQMDFFYRRKKRYAGQFVRKIIPKIKLSENTILYFSTILNSQKKILLSVLVRDVDKVFKGLKIQLPTKNGEIDFEFMEMFIKELESYHIKELESYLQVTGLKDYNLTEKEKIVLSDFENGKIKWREFKIGGDEGLFEKVKVSSLGYKTSELPKAPVDKYCLPALTAGIQNQGLNNYIPKENATILKNVISISANGANTGATFYQNKEFTILQDAYAIEWKNKEKILLDNMFLFFVSLIAKAIYGNYEWTNKAGWEKVKKEKIQVPIKNGEIDFNFMETFISAIQKLVIKDVVDYANEKIKDYHKVIG